MRRQHAELFDILCRQILAQQFKTRTMRVSQVMGIYYEVRR